MKTRALILATVIAFVISSSWPSFADVPTQAALTLAAALGSTVLVSGAAVEGLLPFELSDWKDDRTDSTTQLSQDCTTYSEVRVIGTSRKNFILLGLRNTSMETRYLKFGEIRIAFSTDRERNADLVSKGQDYEFKPNELVVGLIPMPEKSDFKKAEWLEVVVPIFNEDRKLECSLRSRIYHNSAKPFLEETSTIYSTLELDFDVGHSLWRSSNLAALGGNGPSVETRMLGFSSVHHGYVMTLFFETFSNSNYALLSTSAGVTLDSSRSITGLGLYLGYIHRDWLSDRWILTEEVSPGIYDIIYRKLGSSSSDGASLFSLLFRFNLDFRVGRVENGFFQGDYSFGVSVYDAWVPSGNVIGTLSGSGHSLGSSFRFKMGI